MVETAPLFQRDGAPVPEGTRIQTNEKGKPFFTMPRSCARCGGAGGSDAWKHTGWTCYGCGGSGKTDPVDGPLYTQEQLDKLNAAQAKRRARKQAAYDAARAAEKAEADAKRKTFEAAHADVLPWLRQVVADMNAKAAAEWGEDAKAEGFLPEMLSKAELFAEWSEKQATAVRNAKAKFEAASAKRAASGHVGEIGERITATVTVERVREYQRPCYGASWKTETVYIVTMRDEAGNALVSKSTRFWPKEGATITIKATVKEHGEFRGELQTLLERVVDVAADARRKAQRKEWKAMEAARKAAEAAALEMGGSLSFHSPYCGTWPAGATCITSYRDGSRYEGIILPEGEGWAIYGREDLDNWNSKPKADAVPLATGETYTDMVIEAQRLFGDAPERAAAMRHAEAEC